VTEIIDRMIAETITWRNHYSREGLRIDAAASAIRLKALMDVKKAVEGACIKGS
jgi:hypothetical protein